MTLKSTLVPFLALCVLATTATAQPRGKDAAKTKPRRYALLVGVSNYDVVKSGFSPLRFTVKDMIVLRELLIDNGYEKEDITLCISPSPAEAKSLEKTLAELNQPKRVAGADADSIKAEFKTLLARNFGPNDTILVALSGHGIQVESKPPTSIFVPETDTKLDALLNLDKGSKTFDAVKGLYVDISDMYAQLVSAGAKSKIMLVDACRESAGKGGAVGAGKGASNGATSESLAGGGVAALFSCRGGQRSYEDDEQGNGFFIKYVKLGLDKKNHLADLNNDKKITASELFHFMEFGRNSGVFQTPPLETAVLNSSVKAKQTPDMKLDSGYDAVLFDYVAPEEIFQAALNELTTAERKTLTSDLIATVTERVSKDIELLATREDFNKPAALELLKGRLGLLEYRARVAPLGEELIPERDLSELAALRSKSGPFGKADTFAPGDPDAYYYRAMVSAELADGFKRNGAESTKVEANRKFAVEMLDQAAVRDKAGARFPDLYRQRGWQRFLLKQYDEAAEDMKKSSGLVPESVDDLLCLAMAEEGRGRLQAADSLYFKFRTVKGATRPQVARAQWGLGRVKFAQATRETAERKKTADLDDAIKAFENAMDCPDLQEEEFDDIRQECWKAQLERAIQEPVARRIEALDDLVSDWLRTATSREQKVSSDDRRLAWSMVGFGRIQRSIALLGTGAAGAEEATDEAKKAGDAFRNIRPRDSVAHLGTGWAAYLLQDNEAAVESLNLAVKGFDASPSNANHATALELRGAAQEALGKADEAKADRARASKLRAALKTGGVNH